MVVHLPKQVVVTLVGLLSHSAYGLGDRLVCDLRHDDTGALFSVKARLKTIEGKRVSIDLQGNDPLSLTSSVIGTETQGLYFVSEYLPDEDFFIRLSLWKARLNMELVLERYSQGSIRLKGQCRDDL